MYNSLIRSPLQIDLVESSFEHFLLSDPERRQVNFDVPAQCLVNLKNYVVALLPHVTVLVLETSS